MKLASNFEKSKSLLKHSSLFFLLSLADFLSEHLSLYAGIIQRNVHVVNTFPKILSDSEKAAFWIAVSFYAEKLPLN
jgi:hypothetical protein